MSTVLSFRVDDELAARAQEAAVARGVKRAVVLEEALRAFLAPVIVMSETPPRPVRVDTPSQAQRWALERQARLNKAKDKAS